MECKSPSLLGVSKKSHDMKGASLMVLQSLVLFYLLLWDHLKRRESKQGEQRSTKAPPRSSILSRLDFVNISIGSRVLPQASM